MPTLGHPLGPIPVTHSWGALRARWSFSPPSRPGVHPASWPWPGPRSTARRPHPVGETAGVPAAGGWSPRASAPCAWPPQDTGSPGGHRQAWASSPGQHSDLAGPAHPCHPPYILIELLRQFLDVTQNTLGVVLIRPHPSHLVGHQLGEEAGSGSWPGRQGGWALLPAGGPRGRSAPHQTGPLRGRGPPALTRSPQRPCLPAPSSGSHPPPALAGPGRLPRVQRRSVLGHSLPPTPAPACPTPTL